MASLALYVALGVLVLAVSLPAVSSSPEPSLLCRTLVLAQGYPCFDHNVTTEDGFFLALQHIPYGRVQQGANWRPAVLLQHGLMVGAESWVLNPPGQALGLVLADQGFDVWLGNMRGSRWSRGHAFLARTDKAYWDWSWDDMATYDLPAMLNYVSRVAAQERILYVAHSQGTLVALSALQRVPSVAQRMAAAVLLSPVTSLAHLQSRFCHAAAEAFLDKVLRGSGLREFSLDSKAGAALLVAACARPDVDCSHLLAAITGPNCCVNMTRVRDFLHWMPSATSVRNMAHFAQMIRSGRWQRYDYGLANLLRYGSLAVPQYSARDIPESVPLAIAYGGRDALSVPADVAQLVADLRGDVTVMAVPDYAHVDFILSVSAKEDLYDAFFPFLWEHSSPPADRKMSMAFQGAPRANGTQASEV